MHKKLTLAVFLIFIACVCVADYPEARNEYVNDYADVIALEVISELRKKLEDVEYYSGVEITVLTIKSYESYETGSSTWESFSTGLFNRWGVGNRTRNDGVLFLVSSEDRKVRIELGAGYPEHYNAIVKSIIDNNVVPLLKDEYYTDGIMVGVEKIIDATTVKVSFFEWYKWYILGGIGASISLIIALIIDRKKNPGLFWVLLGLAGILVLSVLKGLASGNRSEGFGGGSSDGGGASGDF